MYPFQRTCEWLNGDPFSGKAPPNKTLERTYKRRDGAAIAFTDFLEVHFVKDGEDCKTDSSFTIYRI